MQARLDPFTDTRIAALPRASRVRLSEHAIERYCERVEVGCRPGTARERLNQMATFGRMRSTPRHWMRRRVSTTEGLRFLYWAHMPNVCALVRGDTVVTVVTRAMF